MCAGATAGSTASACMHAGREERWYSEGQAERTQTTGPHPDRKGMVEESNRKDAVTRPLTTSWLTLHCKEDLITTQCMPRCGSHLPARQAAWLLHKGTQVLEQQLTLR